MSDSLAEFTATWYPEAVEKMPKPFQNLRQRPLYQDLLPLQKKKEKKKLQAKDHVLIFQREHLLVT